MDGLDIKEAVLKSLERSPDTTGPTALTALNGLAHKPPGIVPVEATALNPSQQAIAELIEVIKYFVNNAPPEEQYWMCAKIDNAQQLLA